MSNMVTTERPRAGGAPATVLTSREKIRESYTDYLEDESRFGPASADRLVFARDEAQVAAVLSDASNEGGEVTLSAGRTGIVGGAVPLAGTLLSLVEMKSVTGLRRLPDGAFALRAQPGVTIAEVRDRVESRELGIEDPSPETREALEAFLSDDRRYTYLPDPTEDAAHLGATVATNASGARSFLHGATRRHVHGLRVCLVCGDIVAVERGQCVAEGGRFVIELSSGERIEVPVPAYAMPGTKNAAGYYAAPGMDLVDLFVGSEGTLGVITEAEVILAPRPEGVLSALAFFESDAAAVAFVRAARGDDAPVPTAVLPMALEFFDSRSFDFLRRRKSEEGASSEIPDLPDAARAGVLFEQAYSDEDALMEAYDGWEALLSSHGSSMEDTWGGMEEADLARLKTFRHSIAEQVNNVIARAKASHSNIHKIGTDIAVPRGRLDEMLSFYRDTLAATDLDYVVFGHIGDNHLHLNIMPTDDDQMNEAERIALLFAARAVEMGGTVSAEHGIGKLKHAFLRLLYGDEGLREMADLKRSLDPGGVLNRGVMFPSELL